MNLLVILLTVTVLTRQVTSQKACTKELVQQTFPGDRFVIYGLRSDTSIALLPNNVFGLFKSDAELSAQLDKDVQLELRKKHVEVIMMEVHGVLQYIGIWQEKMDPASNLRTCTRLSYSYGYHLDNPTNRKNVVDNTARFRSLFCFADTPSNRFIFKSTKDNRLFAHQQGTKEQYEIVLGRVGIRLNIEEIKRYRLDEKVPFEPPKILTSVCHNTCKWIGRRQQFSGAQFECIAESKEPFGLGMLYGRKNLIEAFFNLGETVFNCTTATCIKSFIKKYGKSKDRVDFGNVHSAEVSAHHQKGSIYVGVRNGLLFSYRVKEQEEKLSEMYLSLEVRNKGSDEASLKNGETLHIFSVNGKETIVLICGPEKAYYHIYNTNPGDSIKAIYLLRSEMTEVKGVTSCRKADYDAKSGKLVIFISPAKALELVLTKQHDGAITTRKDAKLVRFDNYRGTKADYDSTESMWPLQFHNGRILRRTSEGGIEEIKEKSGLKTTKRPLTKFGSYFDALLYFETEYIEEEYINKMYQPSKPPVMYYGVAGCTAFVITRPDLLESLKVKKDGCGEGYKIRALLVNSEMTVLRTKDDKNVEATRFRVTISTNEVEHAINEGEGLTYTRNLTNNLFSGNSFEIAPGTFDTIHNIDDYTYYQTKPREKCTVFFQRRKITEKANKQIEDYHFPVTAVTNKRLTPDTCEYEIQSAMHDEKAHSVVYVMKRGDKIVFATPNYVVTDTFEKFTRMEIFSKAVFSTVHPYVLFQDESGPSVIKMTPGAEIEVTLKSDSLSFVGLYAGKLIYRSIQAKYLLGEEIDVIEDKLNDTEQQQLVTEAVKRQDFEVAAFGVETEIIARPDVFKKKCKLAEAPFFMAFIIKVFALDFLLTLVLTILIIYHRACLIPARRRFKIRMGILKHRRKRRMRDRARRRLRKLNVLRRRRKKAEDEAEAKRQAALLAAAVGAIGLAQQSKGGTPPPSEDAAKKKKKESSSSSSEMVTAHGDAKFSAEPESKPSTENK